MKINHRFTGETLIEINTKQIILPEANLNGAYLSEVDLSGADLSGADLSGVDLNGADLYGANLYGADLNGAYLTGADLYGANLYGADLNGAYLTGAIVTDSQLSIAKNVPIFCKYVICESDGKIRIGCKTNSIEEWDSFFDSDQEFETKRGSEDFKRIVNAYEHFVRFLR